MDPRNVQPFKLKMRSLAEAMDSVTDWRQQGSPLELRKVHAIIKHYAAQQHCHD